MGSDTIRKIWLFCLFTILVILIVLSNKPMDLLILVNYANPISNDFSPQIKVYKGHEMAKEIIEPLDSMVQELNNLKLKVEIEQAYVSVATWQMRFDGEVEKYKYLGKEQAKLKASSIVLLPRYSEHHTGLAIDFLGTDELYTWLEGNAYKYGFILRYPKDKEEITKHHYDRKHYRYVGKKAAKTIYFKNLCLEEYLMRKD